MKINIISHSGRLVATVEADNHSKAIKCYSVNPVKKGTRADFDFVTHSATGAIKRSYWIFK